MFSFNYGQPTDGLFTLFLVFAIVVALLRIGTRTHGGLRASAFTIAWGLLTVTAAFRVIRQGVGGADALAYRNVFDSYHSSIRIVETSDGAASASEPLYLALIHVVHRFTHNYQIYFAATYGLIAFGFIYFVSKTFKETSPILPLFLFFPEWVHSFNIMRNWMGIACFLVALTFYFRKRWLWFYVWTLIGVGFHYSVALMLTLPLFVKLASMRKRPSRVIVTIVLANLVVVVLSSWIAREVAGTRYEYYVQIASSHWTMVAPLVFLTVLYFVVARRSDSSTEEEERLGMFMAYSMGLLSLILYFGGYRYLSFTTIPQAAIASTTLKRVGSKLFTNPASVLCIRITVYFVLFLGFKMMLKTDITLSGIFPFAWSIQ